MSDPLFRQITVDRNQTISQQPVIRVTQSVLNPESSISWKDVNTVLRESYNFEATMDSTALDILALYLKGQKIIYTESKTLCEKRLNTLMLPAIFIAAVCSILNFILKDYPSGTIIISCLNAFNSFLLSLISYLKLDGKAEAHKTSAYKYQKLESMCEFHSGKSLFFQDSVNVCEFVQKIENQVMEVRESNQFIIPELVRVRYPKICETNVFTLVKEIQNDEIIVINNLKTVVQQLHQLSHLKKAIDTEITETRLAIEKIEFEMLQEKKDENMVNGADVDKEKTESITVVRFNELRTKLRDLEQKLLETQQQFDDVDRTKIEAFDRVVKHRARYLKLNETFKDEIDIHNDRRTGRLCCFNPCDWCKT